MTLRLIIACFLMISLAYAGKVKSITGNIIFDANNDGISEAVLNATSGLELQNGINVNGVFTAGLQLISDNVTLSGNSFAFVNTSSGNITVTLPDASSYTGRQYTVKKTSITYAVTLSGNIDSATSYILTSGNTSFVKVMSSGNKWYVIGQSATGVDADTLVTLYSDDFSGGASSILGLAPDVAPGAEVW